MVMPAVLSTARHPPRRCKPKKCRQECKKSCPVVKIGGPCLDECAASTAQLEPHMYKSAKCPARISADHLPNEWVHMPSMGVAEWLLCGLCNGFAECLKRLVF